MVFTYHAIERAYERLRGENRKEYTKECYVHMEIALRSLISPSHDPRVEGTVYKMPIEGYDDYVTVITVEDGVHIVKTIAPII